MMDKMSQEEYLIALNIDPAIKGKNVHDVLGALVPTIRFCFLILSAEEKKSFIDKLLDELE